MNMKKLIRIELQKMNIKKYIKHILIANIGIAFLVLMTTLLTHFSSGEVPNIATSIVIDTLIKSVFIVWESVLIANFIIDEFKSKTILILFSYPLDRKKIIISKLLIICSIIFISMVASQIFQNILFFGLGQVIPLIDYNTSLLEISITFLTTVTAILLGLLSMYVGMLNKSVVATVVSSIIIVSLTISSGGQNGGGLITMVPVSISFGIVGVILALISINKMLSEDIIL